MNKPVDVGVKPPVGPVHLGDGAFASFDGYQIWLGANYPESRAVALEPGAFHNLILFARGVGLCE